MRALLGADTFGAMCVVERGAGGLATGGSATFRCERGGIDDPLIEGRLAAIVDGFDRGGLRSLMGRKV